MQGKKRSHEPVDPEGINNWMQRLGTSKAKPKGATRKKSATAKKKAQIKKKSTARRKTG
jgi:hypothetical protein